MKFKYPQIFMIILCAGLTLTMVSPSSVGAATFETRVIQLLDDAEEDTAGTWVSTDINDLEMGYKLCGIRFQGVSIPKGATITRAYIQFTADYATTGASNLEVWGEGNSNPAPFSPGSTDLLSSRNPQTTAKVYWNNVPDWNSGGEQGYQQQTPELKTIVQEIVDMGTWVSGNAMAFYVGGTGTRTASAWKKANSLGDNRQPLLHIEYTTGAFERYVLDGNDDVEESSWLDLTDDSLSFKPEWYNGVRFQNVSVPQGAEITRAYIEFTSDGNNSEPTGLKIQVEAHDNPPTFSTSNKPSDRTLSSQVVQWSPVEAWSYQNKYQTPDLSNLVQEIVGRSGWSAGNAMAFVIEHYMGQRYAKTTEDPDVASNPDFVPRLYIEFNDGSSITKPIITSSSTDIGSSCYEGYSPLADSITISNSGTADLNFALSDDASWLTLTPASSSLIPGNSETVALTYDMTGLSQGTYTARITVSDSNATNSPVQINVSVTVLEYNQPVTCGAIPVYAQNLVNPAILILLDRSGSMGDNTVAISTNNPQTPNIKGIVQEIIDRDGWTSGNAMAFMIDGTGTRRAISFDSNSSAAPLLHVDYTDASGITQGLNIRVGHILDDAEQHTGSNANPNIYSADLELTYDNYDSSASQIVGIRFRNVTIEKGSAITNAYIEFTIVGEDSQATNLVVWGEDLDNPPSYDAGLNNISNRTKTSTSVAWNNVEPWVGAAQQTRMEVAKEAIGELVKDRSISWGFGIWTGFNDGHDETNDFTKILEGCRSDSPEHQLALQTAIDSVGTGGWTPYWQSIKVAKDYFTGVRDDDDGVPYVKTDCQPKFLINITDGIGNVDPDDSTDENKNILIGKVRTHTEALADEGVTPIAVGFDLPVTDTAQTYEMAAAANEKGKASEYDLIYALHTEKDVDADGDTEGVPFIAHSKQELIDALDAIAENVKGAIFHGSAAATTTSTDLGNAVIVAKFDASRWTGELEAIRKDADGNWAEKVWSASDVIPATRSLWTIDPADATQVIQYEDGTLTSDNFACLNPDSKPIGDIINSKPVVVDTPPFIYPFDNYRDFSYSTTRDAVVYVGANDGALHAFRLTDGAENWAFFPKSMHAKLNLAGVDPLFDRCEREYCHRYFIDGTPVVGDVFADFGKSYDEWRSILVIGGREGSTAYFALDVTSGNNFNHATEPTKFLWEFTDSDLGETWSDPSIRRVAKDGSTDKAWGVFFGSGYAEDDINQPSKKAYLYGLQAHDAVYLWKDESGVPINKIPMATHTGTLAYDNWVSSFYTPDQTGAIVTGAESGATGTIVSVTVTVDKDKGYIELKDITGTFENDEKITSTGGGEAEVKDQLTNIGLGLSNDALASPLLVDMEADYISDRIYIGNLYGNMYRVMDIGKNMTPTVSKLFTFNHSTAGVHPNPIRGSAAFAFAYEKDHIWVYFGTGIFEHQDDKIKADSQYLIGVKDWKDSAYEPPKALPTYQLSDLVTLQAKFVTTSVTIDGEAVDKTFRFIEGANPDNSPWAIELFAQQNDWGWSGPVPIGSERILTKPLAIGGVVYFTTFVPDENVCAGNGETWLLAVDYQNGQVPDHAVFDINGDGMFNEKDYVKVGLDKDGKPIMKPPAGIYVGRGQGSYPVYQDGHLFVTTTGSGDEDKDDGGLTATPINTEDISVRLKSWKQK